ncbi:MAG: M15 family metallopeptidase [Microthrixaceae bacterium]
MTLLCLGTLVPLSAAQADGNGRSRLRDLQRRREQVRSAKATSAAKVDALKASDAQIRAALATISDNISTQTAQLDDARAAAATAEAERIAAEAAEARARKEAAELRTRIKRQALDAFTNNGLDMTLQILSADSLTEASQRNTWRMLQSGDSLDTAEHYRTVQDQLATARAASEESARRAAARTHDVAQRLAGLRAAQEQQQRFSDEVDDRLNAQLAEADSLASLDGALAGQIASQQASIARELAAQRARAARTGFTVRAPSNVRIPSLPNSNGAGIVTVRGIRIDSSMAANLDRLLAAAEAAGIHMSGGGYRDPAGQIAVRRSNCGSSNYAIYHAPSSSCHPPTARPGSSMHERGLAVDFTTGGRTLTRGSAAFAWMRANANSYGFYNLPSEPWHWSSNGN